MRSGVTTEWLVLVAVGGALLLSGFMLGVHALVLLALPVAAFTFLPFLFPFEDPSVEVARGFRRSRLIAGEEAQIEIRAHNRGISMWFASIHDRGANLSIAEKDLVLQGWLPGGTVAEAIYRLAPPRGTYSLTETHLFVSDAIGFKWAETRLSLPDHLTVWPQSEPLSAPSLPRSFPLQRYGLSQANMPGGGTDWLGIRRYLPGDSLRHINWRVTARTQRLHTNEYRADRASDVFLILDARACSTARVEGAALLDRSIVAAASFARALDALGNRVALQVYGGVIDDIVPLGNGRRHLERIMNRLATVSPLEHLAFESFQFLPTRIIKPRNPIYIVTPLLSGDEDVFVTLSRRGYDLTVVLPDPLAFEAQSLPNDRFRELAVRIAHLERELSLTRLIRSGVRVIDWRSEEPLAAACMRAPLGIES